MAKWITFVSSSGDSAGFVRVVGEKQDIQVIPRESSTSPLVTAVKCWDVELCSPELEICQLKFVNGLHQQIAIHPDVARTIFILTGRNKDGHTARRDAPLHLLAI